MSKSGIKDVAERAGVAVGTVSRVLNGHPSVTAEVRARVKAVIQELGYRPDPFARSMRSKISRLIGIVIPNLTNPFFAELVQYAERAATDHGHNVIFMTSFDDSAKEADRLAQLAGRKVDGIIIVPSDGPHPIKAPTGLPLITVDRLIADHPGVAADHRGGARLAVDYLAGLGHRRIACIAGPAGSRPAEDRLQGYLDVMKTLRNDSEPLFVHAAFDFESGRAAGTHLLARPRDERPTALFASSDQQAIGCLRAARDLGIQVPAELSVVGFDGIPLSNLIAPRLTTVVQPMREIADAAISSLLGRRTMPPVGTPDLFQCELAVRESSAAPFSEPAAVSSV
ncbi:LacI family DNA-binding transcriptional regulator [Bradyrhizobium jicamae]|uniref:LacI family DNA-binding transcriptional regulator n=1 Tax=Bradyrhizobium jicamae TaxID=280332 RepID=A0ABS5FFL8_9BRAD|nr:LacI family DNA-binding transcriptional regulator [Bradyrhizobium jicamae]MBR0795578.1 LacI family DNA-binding transcriptional regulator [Bradyrhizobium jicamae]MBR0932618.1 LacI family DNA-binding transcriptional regulator [Bradyrhizobium jicamae]